MKPSLSHLINSKWTKLAARDRFAKHQRRNAPCSAALPVVFQPLDDLTPPLNAPLADYVTSSGLKDVITGQCQECVFSCACLMEQRRDGEKALARGSGARSESSEHWIYCLSTFQDNTDARLFDAISSYISLAPCSHVFKETSSGKHPLHLKCRLPAPFCIQRVPSLASLPRSAFLIHLIQQNGFLMKPLHSGCRG